MATDVLARSARGDAVRDVQTRLNALGFDVSGDVPGVYGESTETAVTRFQEQRGLRIDGVCGPQTWGSLVEAGYALGDRMLYLRTPNIRGDDVLELQRRLGALGFDAGRVDGIFGPRSAQALADFQRNSGLTTDGICGPDTVSSLDRIWREDDAGPTVAAVREHAALEGAPRRLADRRIAVGDMGGLPALADTFGRMLVDAGAIVVVFHDPDESRQARSANGFAADAFVGITLVDEPACRTLYYETDGFSSEGGARLATCLGEELAPVVGADPVRRGMRLPILRETRMTAVVCEIGPPSVGVQAAPAITAALRRGCIRWATAPIPDRPVAGRASHV